MINKDIIDSYKQIKAPSELKQRVLLESKRSSNKSKYIAFRSVAMIAACFMIVCCLFMFGVFGEQVKVEVESLPMIASASRDGDNVVAFVTVECDGEINIKVSDECFYVADGEKNIVSKLNNEYTFEDKIILCWTAENEVSFFTVNGIEYEIVKTQTEIKVNKK
ncbi:MAG: hypothetical protein IKU45_01190 [Clostridia bacterium]|nr:hypothetical protein [Clostridia bacterium]